MRGVDLATGVDEGLAKHLQDALAEHCVLFFRDQQMTPEQHKTFGRRFGELHLHPAYPTLLDGHPRSW